LLSNFSTRTEHQRQLRAVRIALQMSPVRALAISLQLHLLL